MTSHEPHATTASEPATPDHQTMEPVVAYQERLTVAWWMWLVILFVGAATFIALAPINMAVGIIAAVVVMVFIALILYLGSPRIVVTDHDVRVGRAHIERRFVGEAQALRGEAARVARGPELDGRAFMNFRVSVPDMCRIQIVDPVDPTPYWLTATRHPEELARAINADRGPDAQ